MASQRRSPTGLNIIIACGFNPWELVFFGRDDPFIMFDDLWAQGMMQPWDRMHPARLGALRACSSLC
jgi:hypothetical protein